ncbi:MAG: hypothetical protein K0S65_3041 [Labilithrix sp.]|nr:hypothetical protein [Labilithrix sp.]
MANEVRPSGILLLTAALGYLDKNSAKHLLVLYAEIDRMLGSLERALEKRARNPSRP